MNPPNSGAVYPNSAIPYYKYALLSLHHSLFWSCTLQKRSSGLLPTFETGCLSFSETTPRSERKGKRKGIKGEHLRERKSALLGWNTWLGMVTRLVHKRCFSLRADRPADVRYGPKSAYELSLSQGNRSAKIGGCS
ncbi:hypothetical protein NPIL_49831 [Nephila pilipes]|uniref:Uncharacterized protein n=1 Tax=Nephila pilipes TaxID=299642 RepID=A0A8X6Q6V9_NEPPI|nr:hypothetical protein NPIL_49831 [Nephila pilipes]